MKKTALLVVTIYMMTLCAACQKQVAFNQAAADPLKKARAVSSNLQLAMAYLDQKQLPRAKKKLLTALSLDPTSAEANAAMGYFLEQTGEREKARGYYQKALALSPKSAAVLNNYGAFLCRLGEYQKAESYFLKAAADLTYLDTSSVYENAGLCLLKNQDYDKASFYFEKAVTENPLNRRALLQLIQLARQQNHSKKVQAYLRQYQALFKTDPRSMTG